MKLLLLLLLQRWGGPLALLPWHHQQSSAPAPCGLLLRAVQRLGMLAEVELLLLEMELLRRSSKSSHKLRAPPSTCGWPYWATGPACFRGEM